MQTLLGARVALVAVVLALLPALAFGCKCPQRSLADYFSTAEEVSVARLVSTRPIDSAADSARDLDLEFELLAQPHKSARPQLPHAGSHVQYLTAASSAACGLAPVPDGVYILFAYADAVGTLRVDTCSGSRPHLVPGADAVGFDDVPPRFVMQQLNAQAGALLLSRLAAGLPDPANPHNTSVIGLLDITALTHAGVLHVYAEPDASAPVIAEVDRYGALHADEVSYEVSTAHAFAEVAGWYRVRLQDGRFGWVTPADAATFFPYDTLPVNRLAYIRGPWHGFIWPSPGAGPPIRLSDVHAREYPANVLARTRIGGMLWFQVDIMRTSPCEGTETPRSVAGGWVPAYDGDGQALVWYYSRGC